MLSQQHRRTIHAKLAPIVGEEEVDALRSELPDSESDAPATRTDLEAGIVELRGDLAATRRDLGGSIVATRRDLSPPTLRRWPTGTSTCTS